MNSSVGLLIVMFFSWNELMSTIPKSIRLLEMICGSCSMIIESSTFSAMTSVCT